MSVDVAAEVARYRKSAAALRRLTGSNASTEKARRRHEAANDRAWIELAHRGPRGLEGLLAEEEGLVNQLHGVPAGDRPELRARLRVVRAGIAATMKGTR